MPVPNLLMKNTEQVLFGEHVLSVNNVPETHATLVKVTPLLPFLLFQVCDKTKREKEGGRERERERE